MVHKCYCKRIKILVNMRMCNVFMWACILKRTFGNILHCTKRTSNKIKMGQWRLLFTLRQYVNTFLYYSPYPASFPINVFFYVGPPKEDIFSWTPSKSYISSSFYTFHLQVFSSVWVLMRFSCLLLFRKVFFFHTYFRLFVSTCHW